MNTTRICPDCRKPLAPNAPDGLCPACLMKAGAGTGVDIGPDSRDESRRTSFVAPSPEEVARLFPELEILGFIGQGGMGAVYKARQKALDRVVALKILPPGIGGDPAFAQRFTREAKALAKLNHPGIVTLYEFGQADGLFYFLMEFVDGVNLRHLLEAGRLSPREALAIVPQICDALQYAHDHGIVHRDIKPENILLDRRGHVKVADFGLAKLVGTEGELSAAGGGAAGSIALTEVGKVMGTPQYMAPEQREHPAEVDHRADIYSLGVVFYQMLTGELPGRPIEPPSHTVRVDVRLDEVVLRALERQPERRYQHAGQLKTAVETIGQSCPPADGSPQPADWRTWSPFQSRQVRDICDHMTEAERREWTLRGALFGIWNAATFFVPWGIALFVPKPLNWIFAPIVLLVGLAFYPLWRRITREFLASTIWARQQGIAPESLPMGPHSILVGRRSGRAVIHWPGVLLVFVLMLAVAEGGVIAFSTILTGTIDSRAVGIAYLFVLIIAGVLVRGGMRTPVQQLTGLDGPDDATCVPPGNPPLFVEHTGRRGVATAQKHPRKARLYRLAGVLSLFSGLLWCLAPLVGGGTWPCLASGMLSVCLAIVLLSLGRRAERAAFAGDKTALASGRSRAAWPWIVAAVGVVLLVPAMGIGYLLLSYSPTERIVRRESPNRVLEVRCEGPKAYVQAELDDRHDLHLFIGNDALGWSAQQTGSTSVTATVEASSQIKMEDGSMGRGLIFQAWGSRHYIAISPEGPVPHGEVVFRTNPMITQKDGTFTFADIRQANGMLIPVSIRVRPASGGSSKSWSFGPVIERVIAAPDADDQGLVFFDLETGKSVKPPFPLMFHPNQGPAFVELTPELKQWIKARDVDLLLHLGEKTWDMMTLEMQERFAGKVKEWETVSADKVMEVFAKKDAEHVVLGHSYGNRFGSFNAFRTRTNTMGVYQFEGVDNATRRGARLRYKLVRPPTSSPGRQVAQGRQTEDPEDTSVVASRVTSSGSSSASQAARLALQQAQANVVAAKARYENGMAGLSELQAAQLARDLAEAEMSGNTAEIPRIKLRFAQEQLVQTEARFKVGKASQAELGQAKLAKDLAEARLAGDEKAESSARKKDGQSALETTTAPVSGNDAGPGRPGVTGPGAF
jgi:predicted Ser/Thr protein kinase